MGKGPDSWPRYGLVGSASLNFCFSSLVGVQRTLHADSTGKRAQHSASKSGGLFTWHFSSRHLLLHCFLLHPTQNHHILKCPFTYLLAFFHCFECSTSMPGFSEAAMDHGREVFSNCMSQRPSIIPVIFSKPVCGL